MPEEHQLNRLDNDELVMALVEMALARPPDEREPFLRSACSGNPQVFDEIWRYVQQEERMKGFLLEPLFSLAQEELPLSPGYLLDQRFRIVREVGQGGMAFVYEVYDEKLEKRIAIKWPKTGFRKRVPPEVRHATEISHPNICKVFEIHTASLDGDEIDFLTMEFLEGETLAERMRRGPAGKPEALSIARQLCEGLAEAHHNRVIHGDLKSNNVILTAGVEGAIRAVITDFGLARKPEAARGTAQSGEGGGTPGYMAPELWKGANASVSSDIYALGVILFELASGRLPNQAISAEPSFSGPERSWEERLAQKPPPLTHPWNPILQRCLDPDPAKRFRTAEEVAKALLPQRSRRWLLGGTAAAAVLAIATGMVTYQQATAPQESVRLAMLPFESAVPQPEGLFRDVASQLARLKGNAHTSLTVVPSGKNVDTVDQARRVLGATHVLRAALEKEKGHLILRAHLTDARSRVNFREWKAEYSPGEERYIPVALAGVVTGTLHLPPLAVAIAVNEAARQDYLAGRESLRHDTGVAAAIASFTRAVAAHPDSPLTHAGLAEAQWFQYFLTKDRAWLDRSAQSAREAERRNPDLAPVHRIAGMLRRENGLYELAATEYRRAVELEPNDAENYRRLGQVYEHNNQLQEALAALQTVLSLQPDYYRAHQDLGAYYYNRGDYKGAVAPLRLAVGLAPNEPNVHFALGATCLNIGMYGEAEQQLRLAVGLEEAPRALHSLGLALMYQERDEEATSYFLRALRRNPENYLSHLYLGISNRRIHRMADSKRANLSGQQVADKELARNPRSGYVRSILGYFSAVLGDRRRAESETVQALSLSPDDSETRWFAALTYEALKQREETLAVLRRSSGQQLLDISRWPDVADLRRDSRFEQLLAANPIKE